MNSMKRKLLRRRGPGGLGALVETDAVTMPVAPENRGAGSWKQNPFGPFEDPRDVAMTKKIARERVQTDDMVDHDHVDTLDVRGKADWYTIFRKDTSAFQWGALHIDCLAVASPTQQTTVQTKNHVEARVIGFIGGSGTIRAIQAIASRQDQIEGVSSGPLYLKFDMGDVPDRIEVEVRARQGGQPENTINADETLMVSLTSRFHR